MYNDIQIQNMIDTLNNNAELMEVFRKELTTVNPSDCRAILNVIESGDMERFCRYDSDVCEQFIRLYEKVLQKL